MRIKDLPKEIKELALKRQVEAGNLKDAKIPLVHTKYDGGFNFNSTPEGYNFWNEISEGRFDDFYAKYPETLLKKSIAVEEIEVKGSTELDQTEEAKSREGYFETVIGDTLQGLQTLMLEKGREYRRNNNPYHVFEKGSILTGRSREEVLQSFLLKHLISVEDMRNDSARGAFPTEAKIHEKYDDILVYFLIEKAMMLENAEMYNESLAKCKESDNRRAVEVLSENYEMAESGK